MKTWRDIEKFDGKTINKTQWKKRFKQKPSDSSKKFNGKIYARPNYSIRNDKVNDEKSRLRKLGYSVRTVKEGKFTTIFRRPNFEKSRKKKN